MEGNQKIALLVSVSFVGVLSLFAYSLMLDAVDVEVGDIDMTLVGRLVRLRGTIASIWQNSRGDVNIVLTDGLSHIRVYIPEDNSPSGEGLLPGSLIVVKGEVQLYNGELEIFVSSSAGVQVLSSSNEDAVPLGFLAEMPDVLAGETVRVRGTIDDLRTVHNESGITGTSFTLRASGYQVPCIIFGWNWEQNHAGISNGSLRTFEATWGYYPMRATWQLVSESPSFEP